MRTNKEKYKANIWKSNFYRFFSHFHFFSAVLIPFFTLWGGISFAQVMILQAIFTFSVFALEIPTGVIADKFSRKASLILASLVSLTGFLIYTISPNFWIFALGEFTLAFATSLISGADQAMVYDSLREIKKEKTSKKVLGRIESTGLLSLMIAAPIGGLIAQHIGLRAVMLFMAIPTILMFFIALTMKEPEMGRKHALKRNYSKTLKKGMQYFKEHRILKMLAFEYISISTLVFFLIWVYQVKLQELNVEIGLFGFVHAAMVIVQIFILQSFTGLEKLIGGKKRYLLISAVITGLAFILVAFSKTVPVAIAGILVASAFGLTRKPLIQNYLNKFINSGERATVLSTISMIYMFVMSIIYIVLGYFADLNLQYTLAFIGLAIILFSLISKVEESHLRD